MPPDTVIENPVLNAPFEEPSRHFLFDDTGITSTVVEERRPSSYFVPIPAAKRSKAQLVFETEWTADRIEQNHDINRIREQVGLWRQGGRLHITGVTRRLIDYWTDEARERRLFFAQIEALDTAIWLTEAAEKVGQGWVRDWLRERADDANPGLLREAHKMATGSGKTVVMAMMIAWHTLNKAANPQDNRSQTGSSSSLPASRSRTVSGCFCRPIPTPVTGRWTWCRPTWPATWVLRGS